MLLARELDRYNMRLGDMGKLMDFDLQRGAAASCVVDIRK
jgi:hypothetical protein